MNTATAIPAPDDDKKDKPISRRVKTKRPALPAIAYTAQEVANLLAINARTVTRKVHAKEWPQIPNIGVIRIPRDFVDKMIAAAA